MSITPRIINDLNTALALADKKHPPIDSDMAALGVITEEYHEVIWAIRKGEAWKVRAELLDLANACIRRVVAMDGAA